MLPRSRGAPLLAAALLGACARRAEAPAPPAHPSCFVLYEVGVGEVITSSAPEQPFGLIVDASGEHAFDAPWPSGTSVGARTGRGEDLQWLAGHVRRHGREWIFVSCVTGPTRDPDAAIRLAADSLRSAGVL